jgi:hypothetical protein
MPGAARIIIYLCAVIIQHGLFPPAVFKAVQEYPDSLFMKRPDLVKKIKHASVIRGIGDIMANNMKIFFRHVIY